MQLIQPRHSYAPPHGVEAYGHIYFPTGLYTAAARFRAAGVDVEVVDENIQLPAISSSVVGISVIGPPYVSAARRLMELASQGQKNATVLVGGQGARGFKQSEFSKLFGESTINGWDDSAVLAAIGRPSAALRSQENISLVDELKRLPDWLFNLYFSREFSLFLSQGCRYSCTFCSAVRTRRDPLSGETVLVREQYRRPEIVADELRYILSRCSSSGIGEVNIYLSNLDLFQSPGELSKFVDAIEPVTREASTATILRGLATTQSFLSLHRTQPDLIQKFVDLGLRRVGFGIDGATPAVWKGIRKPQSNESCLTAVQVAAESYGLVPEALMVFGHEGHDDASSLALAVETTKRLTVEFGAIPRPHVAKGVIPGNDGWVDSRNRTTVDYLLSHPAAFQMLDYTCLPSWLTHREPEFRAAVANAFLEICELPGTLTQYVTPEDPSASMEELEEAKAFNCGKYDI